MGLAKPQCVLGQAKQAHGRGREFRSIFFKYPTSLYAITDNVWHQNLPCSAYLINCAFCLLVRMRDRVL